MCLCPVKKQHCFFVDFRSSTRQEKSTNLEEGSSLLLEFSGSLKICKEKAFAQLDLSGGMFLQVHQLARHVLHAAQGKEKAAGSHMRVHTLVIHLKLGGRDKKERMGKHT